MLNDLVYSIMIDETSYSITNENGIFKLKTYKPFFNEIENEDDVIEDTVFMGTYEKCKLWLAAEMSSRMLVR